MLRIRLKGDRLLLCRVEEIDSILLAGDQTTVVVGGQGYVLASETAKEDVAKIEGTRPDMMVAMSRLAGVIDSLVRVIRVGR